MIFPFTRRRILASALAAVTASAMVVVPAMATAGAAISVTVHGSIDAVYVTAPAGSSVTLTNSNPTFKAISATTDTYGALVFHDIAPGKGYKVSVHVGPTTVNPPSFAVLNQTTPPAASLYSKVHLKPGLNYLPMRDGITLAATLRLPWGKTSLSQGPFPTLIEYSGYGAAAPGSLIDNYLGKYTGDKALLPDTSTAIGAAVGPALGYAVVSLQMRGSACSGGAFDLFGPAEPTDGYDAIEEVARQPFVANHKVGLFGISYSGISEFGPAGLNPPGLASIAPMSPTDDLYSTGSPGGITNTGFAAGWIAERVHDALPASATGGQRWAWAEIQAGDATCAANQLFHSQAQDVEGILGNSPNRIPALYNPRSPLQWASKIKVPVFLVGALQDEQTGPQWTDLIKALSGDKDVYATVQNGTHGDALAPDVINRWEAFNSIFVAKKVPTTPGAMGLIVTSVFENSVGGGAPLVAVPYTSSKSLPQALAAFRAGEGRVTVNFDNGNSSAGPGKPAAAYSAKFTAYPPTSATKATLYLGPNGTLVGTAPSASSTSYVPDPTARPATSAGSHFESWAAQPNYNWAPVTGSDGVAFTSAALSSNTTVVGKASLNLTFSSTAPDVDFQATVSEVRPDGSEMYVTTGWLRASYSKTLMTSASSAYQPFYSYLTASSNLYPATVRVPIDGIGYTFRAGSKIRVTLSAPGGDRPSWAFANTYASGGTTTINLGPSAFVFPVVAGITPTDSQPACGSNRGQPCRTYIAAGNGG